MNPQLSVVVPLFNEEECAQACLTEIRDHLDRAGLSFEIIAVDNGSKDKTPEIVDKLAAEEPRLKPLHFHKNCGYGGAIVGGIKKTSGAAVGFICGGGEVSPEGLIRVFKVLEAGRLDLVKAKRVSRRDGGLRKLFSVGYHILVGFLFKLHTTDINGYPVVMTRSALDKIAPSRGDWIINVEILAGARRAELLTAEVDVLHRERQGGRSKVRFWFPILFFFQLLRFRNSFKG